MNTDKNVAAIYEMLKSGMTDEEFTKLVNEAQKKIDEDKKAEEIRQKKIDMLDHLRDDVVNAAMDYYAQLGVEFDEETEELIYQTTIDFLKKEEKNYPLFNNSKREVKMSTKNKEMWEDFFRSLF